MASPQELLKLKKRNTPHAWRWKTLFLGQRMQHNYYLHHFLNIPFINQKQIASIVEIGTGNGALTAVLGCWGVVLDIPVLTLDFAPHLSGKLHPLFDKLGIECIWGDEWAEENLIRIKEFIAGKPTYVICDGGNKVKELQFWSPRIVPTSLISVHDWGVEVLPRDVPKNLEPYHPKRWTEMNIQFATWMKK